MNNDLSQSELRVAASPSWGRACAYCVFDLILVLALWSYDAHARSNAVGLCGHILAHALVGALGWGAWLVPWAVWRLAVWTASQSREAPNAWRLVPVLACALYVCGTLHVLQRLLPALPVLGHRSASGVLGELVGGGLLLALGSVGSAIACASVFLVWWTIRCPTAHPRTIALVARAASNHWRHLTTAWRRSGEMLDERIRYARATLPTSPVLAARSTAQSTPLSSVTCPKSGSRNVEVANDPPQTSPPTINSSRDSEGGGVVVEQHSSASLLDDEADPVDVELGQEAQTHQLQPELKPAAPPASPSTIVLPRAHLLCAAPPSRAADCTQLDETAQRLEEKLLALKVDGKVEHIKPGRIVTLFQFRPPASTRVSELAKLGADLSLALEADGVRVIAPLPGTARIGIEVPNAHRADIYLRELVEDDRWTDHHGALPIVLGMDIANTPLYADLAAMPHLLVAGATGSGKSVGINAMLLSLLLRFGPADLNLILIDPKLVELAPFAGVPHLQQPVVTDMRLASRVLDSVVQEMETRYALFAAAGVRNLQSYNRHVERVRSSPVEETGEIPQKLPYIIFVIDELADLTMVAGKSVLEALMRLAQKSRAAGIHGIVATQRPSVKVITGDIKANFPARLSYKVAQYEDSDTILGRSGAEHLLGRGDMLCLLPGERHLKRAHGPFVSDDDVKAVCDHLRAQAIPSNVPAPVAGSTTFPVESGGERAEDAELLDRAIALVASAGKCSATMLQTRLGIGYPKASRLVTSLEQRGVVGPAPRGGNAAREVYVRPS